MTSAIFNSSGKDFVEIHLLIQFVIVIKIYFLANLMMAGDISPLEHFFSVKFIYVSQNYVCRNKFKFKVEIIPKFIYDFFDTCMIVKVTFSSIIYTILRNMTPFLYS